MEVRHSEPGLDGTLRVCYTLPMTQTHDITNDPDVVTTRWYANQAQVMRVFAGLQSSGWWITHDGLMTSSKSGSLVARPLKIKGQTQFTGIAIWRYNPVNEA